MPRKEDRGSNSLCSLTKLWLSRILHILRFTGRLGIKFL